MIRAAIVGLGRWGRALVTAATGKTGSTPGSSDLRFVLGTTRTRASAEDFCRDKQIKLVDSYDDILRDPDIDAVVLATPHSQHQPQALAGAEAAHKSGLILAVGFTRRFHPSIGELRARVADGRLGKVIALVAQHTTSTAQFV